MGAIAKAAATYVTYPLQIAQSRLRADKKGKKDENGKMARALTVHYAHTTQSSPS